MAIHYKAEPTASKFHRSDAFVRGLRGPIGTGKSVTLKCILGLLQPDAGSVARSQGLRPHAFQKLYQDPVQAFAPHVTLHTALHDVLKHCGQPLASLETLLHRLRLSPGLLARKPSQVSGGELQRLALIRTLLLQPALLEVLPAALSTVALPLVADVLRRRKTCLAACFALVPRLLLFLVTLHLAIRALVQFKLYW